LHEKKLEELGVGMRGKKKIFARTSKREVWKEGGKENN